MKKELGKWLMDIAKYIITAVILSSVFGEAETWTLYLGGGISVVTALGIGLYLVSDKPISMSKLTIFNKKRKSKSK